jgi:cystathionine beta-synthase
VTREEGILIGGSGGLAVAAALRVAAELDESAFVVVLLPDSGRGYLSKIFNDEWMADYGFLTDQTQPTVLDVLRRKGADLPELVHVHPDETVGSAIHILREYGVSQMPVVKAEPPVMAAEVVGSVIERDLLDAVFSDHAALDQLVERHMSKALPTVGSGEPVNIVITALEAASAALVLDDGKPIGVLTRADLLGYLASHG